MLEENSIGLFEAIYTTRALRRFKPDPVPDEVLFQLFDAGYPRAVRPERSGLALCYHYGASNQATDANVG